MASFRKSAKIWRVTYSALPPDSLSIEDVKSKILDTFTGKDIQYVIGLERHPEPRDEERPFHIHAHIQCNRKLESTNPRILDIGEFHPSIGGQFGPAYASKDGNYITNRSDESKWKPLPKPRVLEPKFEWQLELVEQLKKEPDDRTIHWIWDETGGKGKTQFARWAIVTKTFGDAILVGGKASDVKHAVAILWSKRIMPNVIFFNVPRHGTVSYTALEEVKDATFFSPKYESDMVVLPYSPHIVVFANKPPVLEKMSLDKWNIIKLD